MATTVYGVGVYGVDTYGSNIQSLTGIKKLYLGSEVQDGREADAVFDELQVFLVDKSDADITAIYGSTTTGGVTTYGTNTTPATYTTSHELLAHLDSDLEGGDLFVQGLEISQWRIYRKRSNKNQYKLIKIIDNDSQTESMNVVDYECANETDYDYAIEGITANGLVSTKYEYNGVRLHFQGSWLVNKDTGETFHFRYNPGEVSISVETDRAQVKTFSQFPIVRKGIYQSKRGQLSCDLVDYNNNPVALIEEVDKLIAMQYAENLVLKLDTGDIFDVEISNIVYKRHQETNEIIGVSCDFVQVGEVE